MNQSGICDDPSSNSVSSDYWTLKEDTTYGVVIAAFFLLYEIVGLPWNILVVFTIIREKLFQQPTVILLLNLVAADLFLLVYPVFLIMTTGFSGEYIIGSSDKQRCATCGLSFALTFPFYSLLFTVALMSLDRFVYIYKPFQYERTQTKYVAWAGVVVTVLISMGLGFGSQFDGGEVIFHSALLGCSTVKDVPSSWLTIVLLVIGASQLVVIIISNICFACIVVKNIRAVYSLRDYMNESKNQSYWKKLKKNMESPRCQKQVRLYRVFFALLFTSLLTWIPLLVVFGEYIHFSHFSLSTRATGACIILVYLQVILHPMLETFLITDVRKPLTKMITCGLSNKEKSKATNKERVCVPFIADVKCYCSFLIIIEAAIITQIESCHSNNENAKSLNEIL